MKQPTKRWYCALPSVEINTLGSSVVFLVTTFTTGPCRHLHLAFPQCPQRNSQCGTSGDEPPSPLPPRRSRYIRSARGSELFHAPPIHPRYVRGDGALTGAPNHAADMRSPRRPWALLSFHRGTAPLSDLRHCRPPGSPAPLSHDGQPVHFMAPPLCRGASPHPPQRVLTGSDPASPSMLRPGDCGSRGRAHTATPVRGPNTGRQA
ncbi:hypothetical protein NDU88_002802 [Pleurodeles waltl]|uniref:Uncharacterized protein n=1 Tax=Pleurodeles waltl TaxID=8319 RepID=A0AAV7T3S6_PLEWA|nr:hypothetical protein NDU88_002802 [Pleurodeles waltl]